MMKDIARYRLKSQLLAGESVADPAEVVRWMGAVQSQDYGGAKWGLAQRTKGVDSDAIDRAFNAGAILRTHVLRPTWHFVHPEDIRWMLALTGPRVIERHARRFRELELDPATLGRSLDLMASALRDGRFLTRKEIGGVLEAGGISTEGQRLAHMLMHAELRSVTCSGPFRRKENTYALLDKRAPAGKSLSKEEALAELAGRYFTSHGPATVKDFAWWSWLPMADARLGLELAGLSSFAQNGLTYWMLPSAAPAKLNEPAVHLLPNFDEYVVAYRDRTPTYHPELGSLPGYRADGGLSSNMVALDGVVVGGWRRKIGKRQIEVETALLVGLDESAKEAFQRAVEAYGRFMGLPVAWE